MIKKQTCEGDAAFLVWDSNNPPPIGNWIPVYWRGVNEGGNGLSIPLLLEKQSALLRSRFLAWLYHLGESDVGGLRVVDNLELRQGFSYWWVTLLAEKSYAKSPRLRDALCLLVLEGLVAEKSVNRIILGTSDTVLERTIRSWCARAGLDFECRSISGNGTSDDTNVVPLTRRIFRDLPQPIKAIAYLLCYIWKRWPLRKSDISIFKAFDSQITIVDYLFQLAPKALATGQFESNYWTDLVTILKKNGVRANWLHHFFVHEAVPTAQNASKVLAEFNQNAEGLCLHSALDGELSWDLIRKVIRDYFRIFLMGLRLREVRDHFVVQGSNADLWPLLKNDWRDSMFGTTAIANCLYLNLFESFFNRMPSQKLGIYLQENQGWERALIYAWKSAGHGRLVGVPHTCINFWDMRFFADVRTYEHTGRNDCPNPDLVALNGSVAIAAFREGGYPENWMTEVEALRYRYLNDVSFRDNERRSRSTKTVRVLILGDYTHSVTQRQLQWLSKVVNLLPSNYIYNFKPHPACPINVTDFPSLPLIINKGILAEQLSNCDVAYTSNSTNAAVDAHIMGIPVVSIFDGSTLNLSPLRGREGVLFASTPKELASALISAASAPRLAAEWQNFFTLDPKLPRWRKLLLESVE